MPPIPLPTPRPVPGLLATALTVGGLAISANAAGAADHAKTAPMSKHRSEQRLVVRGDATAVDGPCDAAGVCPVELTDGRFRGTPVGTGTYSGSVKLDVAAGFANGEGGFCAPLTGRVVLGAGTPDRLALAVAGDSCQDGAGPLTAAAFTGLAQFKVTRATGSYSGVTGAGLASFSEDAAKHHRMTLIGRIARWGSPTSSRLSPPEHTSRPAQSGRPVHHFTQRRPS